MLPGVPFDCLHSLKLAWTPDLPPRGPAIFGMRRISRGYEARKAKRAGRMGSRTRSLAPVRASLLASRAPIDGIPTRVESMRARMRDIPVGIESMRARMRDIPVGIESMRARMCDIPVGIESMHARMRDIPVGIESMRARMRDIPVGIESMRARMRDMRARIDPTGARVGEIALDVDLPAGRSRSVRPGLLSTLPPCPRSGARPSWTAPRPSTERDP